MTKKMMGLVGLIGMLITAGVIGYVIGDNYGLDFYLLGELILVYAPPIIGSIFMTLFITTNCDKQKDVVTKNEETE